jgi:hypothetical protein
MASPSNIELLEPFQLKTLHDSGRTLVCAEYSYLKGSPNTKQLKKKSTTAAVNTVLTSVHTQMT